MRTAKPILGQKEVVILDATKKGTDDRFTITILFQVKGTQREFKDVLFYDENNTARVSVLPAILRALADQTGLQENEFITEVGEELEWNVDKVVEHIKGKTITVVRTQVISERNGQVYHNVNYRPETVVTEEEAVAL